MRLSSATVGLLLGLALIFSACGESGTTAGGGGEGQASRREAARSNSAARARPGVADDVCRRQLHGFLAALTALRRELASGLSYDDYLQEIERTRAAYAGIRPGRLGAGCLIASAAPAERAFNLYIDATNTWGDCLATLTCDTRTIEPRLQRKWALASRQLTLALRAT